MPHFFALLLSCWLAFAGAVYASDGRMNIIQPNDVTANASTKKPATANEVSKVLQLQGIEEKIKQAIAANNPIVKQSLQEMLRKTAAANNGAPLQESQIRMLSERVAARQKIVQEGLHARATASYIKKHQNIYSQAETLQLLAFLQSPLGQKFARAEDTVWASIVAEINAASAREAPAAVAQVFKEAGYVR